MVPHTSTKVVRITSEEKRSFNKNENFYNWLQHDENIPKGMGDVIKKISQG